jgi:MFS family permease
VSDDTTRPGEILRSVPRDTGLVVGSISVSQFFNHSFLVLLPPILPVLSEDLDVSLALLGVALGAQALVNTAFQIPFGYLADRYDRTLTLGISSVLGGVGALLTAVAPNYATLIAAQVVLGVGVAGHHPAHYPLLTDATADSVRGRAFAVYNFGGSLGFATPPVVVTAVVAVPGLSWRHAVFLVGAAGLVYAVVVTALFALRVDDEVTAPNLDPDAETETETEVPLTERVRTELRSLVAEPGILALSVLALVSSTASWGLTSYAVVFLTTVYAVPLGVANLTLTGVFVVGAGAILLGGTLTDRFGGGTVLIVSYVGLTGLVASVATGAVPAAAAIALFLLIGGARSVSGPARDELTERLATSGTVGKSFAVVTIGIMLGSAIAPPAFGLLIERGGVRTAFFVVAGVTLLATVVTGVVVARVQADRTPRPATGD